MMRTIFTQCNIKKIFITLCALLVLFLLVGILHGLILIGMTGMIHNVSAFQCLSNITTCYTPNNEAIFRWTIVGSIIEALILFVFIIICISIYNIYLRYDRGDFAIKTTLEESGFSQVPKFEIDGDEEELGDIGKED